MAAFSLPAAPVRRRDRDAVQHMAQPADRRRPISKVGGRVAAHAQAGSAQGARLVRSVRRLRLFPDPARLRAAGGVRAPARRAEGSGLACGADAAHGSRRPAAARAAPHPCGSCAQLPGDRFALDDLGASVNGNPAIAAFVDHHDLLYADLKDPVALLRGEIDTNLSRFWPYAGKWARGRSKSEDPAESGWPRESEDGRACAYSDLMSRTQPLVAEDILDAYPLRPASMPPRCRRRRRRLSRGGGEARAAPGAEAVRSSPRRRPSAGPA